MSDFTQGPGWWQASDGKWYPPEAHPSHRTQPLPPPPAQPFAPAQLSSPAGQFGGKAQKPWWRRWWAIAIGALLVLGVVGAIAGKNKDEETDGRSAAGDVTSKSQDDEIDPTSVITAPGASEATDPAEVTAAPDTEESTTPAPESTPPSTLTPATVAVTVPATEPGSDLTPSQQNAVRAAESYLDFTAFSRQGLIDQLSSEYGDQFPVEDATIAVDSLGIDWAAEAGKSAQSYLDMSGFSRQGLIDQLSSEYGEQFTLEEATGAVDGLNVDWNAEAAQSAQSYLDFSSFSCKGLIDQLSSQYGDQYTVEEATYGATQTGIC